MSALLHAVGAHAGRQAGNQGVPRWGTVQSIDGARCMIRAIIQPEGIPTAWIPLAMPWTGGGWGMVALPQPGQQVLLLPEYGDAGHPVAIAFGYSNTGKPPQAPSAPAGGAMPAQAGELLLMHASGTVLRLCANGTIYSKGPWSHEGTFSVTGAVTATGNVTAGNGTGDQTDLQGHTHPYQPGSGNVTQTGAPKPGS